MSSYPRICAFEAGTIINGECKQPCDTVYFDTCQECVVENLREECQRLPHVFCPPCVKNILTAVSLCNYPNSLNLECVESHVWNRCWQCICPVTCQAAGPENGICKLCKDESTIDPKYWHDTLPSGPFGSKKCPPTWHRSLEANPKCFKAFQEEFTWIDLAFPQTKGCPANSRVAIVDTPNRGSAVASALRKAFKKSAPQKYLIVKIGPKHRILNITSKKGSFLKASLKVSMAWTTAGSWQSNGTLLYLLQQISFGFQVKMMSNHS